MTARRLSRSMIGLAALSSVLLAGAAQAAGYTVPLDEVRMITFKTAAKTVFIGNPVIADVTVIDPQHVFLLGKTFGTTNLIALDEKGRQTVNTQITVFDRPGSIVTLHRGAAKSTLACTTARCESAPTPGDDSGPFDSVTKQIDTRQALSMRAAGQ